LPAKKEAFQAIDKPKGKGRVLWDEFGYMGWNSVWRGEKTTRYLRLFLV